MIFFLFSFHCVRAFSGSHRVVSFEAEKSELEFLKAWSYLEIINLRPHSDPTCGLPRTLGFQLALPWYKTYRVEGRGQRGCICMEAFCVWKMMQIAETKRREKQRIFACDGLLSTVNQSSRRGLRPY